MLRNIALCVTALFILCAPAHAEIEITVDIATQRMAVFVDGKLAYTWPVATAARGYHTPRGMYQPYWLDKNHYSSVYNNAPMPYSIFFERGYAIHGSYDTIGRPASHGCVRLHPQNAAVLFQLISAQSKAATTIVIR